MGRLTDYCVYDSQERSTCVLSAGGSGVSLSITVQKDERLLVYDLEAYLGESSIKRPDRLLVGRVGKGPWVVVLVELKSETGWDTALRQFREVLPALGKGGDLGGEQHHQESGKELPLGKEHRVIVLVVGQVGKEYRKFYRRDRKTPDRKKISWERKTIDVLPPMSGKAFPSLANFWVQLGVLPRSRLAG